MPSFDNPATFAAIAADLLADPQEEATAQTIVQRLAELVGDADEVSLTVRTREGHRTLAATGELSEQADALQYELGEGPCLFAAEESATWIRSADVGADPRWPAWGRPASELGIGSLLAVQLLGGGRPQGALNLYSKRTDQFDDGGLIDVALVYAIHAANALGTAQLASNLYTALGSRHGIGMAQGIVMERFGLDQQSSFELLRRLSSVGSMKLRDVAAHIVETRELPELPAQDGDPGHEVQRAATEGDVGGRGGSSG